MSNKTLTVALVVVAVIATIGIFFPSASKQVTERIVERLGAVSTLENVDNPNVGINGVGQYYYSQGINNATSSNVCTLKNPFNATSTVLSYSVYVRSNGLGAQPLYLSTSTATGAPDATSTPALIAAYTLASGSGASFAWAPTASTTATTDILQDEADGTAPYLLGPSDYLNLHVASGTPGTFSTYLVGTCSGVLQKI